MAERLGERIALGSVVVGDDDDAGAHVRHVAGHEAMDNRGGEDAVLAFQRHQTVDEGAHRLAAGRIDGDHAAIEGRNDRLDLAPQRAQRQLDDMFAALLEVRMRKFEEGGHDIETGDAQHRQMAMRVEFGGDQHIRPDQGPNLRQQVAFGIVIALGNHRAMQAEHYGIDRHRRPQLVEDLVAQHLIGAALDETGGLRPAGSTFDDGKAFRARPAPQDRHDRGAERRRFRMLARPGIERRLEGVQIRRNGGECVGFGRKRRGENAHEQLIRSSSAVRTRVRPRRLFRGAPARFRYAEWMKRLIRHRRLCKRRLGTMTDLNQTPTTLCKSDIVDISSRHRLKV